MVCGVRVRDEAELFAGPGKVAALLREYDWSQCLLGPPSQWRSEWQTAMRMMLASGFPMCLTLDREKRVFFHNDPYIPIVAEKFPWCLGRTADQVWPEISAMMEPHRAAIHEKGVADGGTDLRSVIKRHGRLEEVYFSYWTNPLLGDDREQLGFFTVLMETTARVLAERRLACLRDLAVRAFDAETVEDACSRGLRALQGNVDVPAAMVYVIDDDGQRARRIATVGEASRASRSAEDEIALSDAHHPLRIAETVRTRCALPLGELEGASTTMPRGYALPILERVGDRVGGVLVAEATSYRPLAEVQDFLVLVTAQLGTALTNARAKQHAAQRARELAALDQAKTEFLANISHELRTPLTLIMGPLSEVLAASRLTSEDRTLLEHARSAGSRMQKLVKSLLEFARVEAGRAEPHYEPVDLAAYTRELTGMFETAFQAAGIRFVVDAPALPELVCVDREMWETIVLNLLSNALKFTFEGEVRLQLRLHEGAVRLSVSDTGCGIAAKDLPHLFERFHRIDAPKARTREGSGIGLSLVRELARLHGGSVSAQSAPGVGTTIHIDIRPGSAEAPRARMHAPSAMSELFHDEALSWIDASEELPPSAAAAAAAPLPAAEALGPLKSRARILLADDNAQMRAFLRRILSPHWEVHSACDGAAALALARRISPDLIVADVMMPELDGFGLIAALRAEPATAELPVLLLSARAGDEAIEQALQAGAVDYVVKPFSVRELLARVQVQLAQVSLQRAERAAREIAEHGSRTRERFLAVLSHEMRSPLTSILCWAELLRTETLAPEDARSAFEVIEQSVSILSRLVEDLLDVSRLVAGRLALKQARIESLAPALETVVDALRLKAAESGVSLETSLESNAGPVRGDVQRLQQVATNLIGNAIKFTPRGGTVRVYCMRIGAEVELSVSDNGRGIPAAAMPHLFDEFWMGNPHEGRGGGLGLGLAIVSSLVKLHGGTLRAESLGEHRGATFTVRLPVDG